MGNTLHLSNETLDAILATAGLHPPKPKSAQPPVEPPQEPEPEPDADDDPDTDPDEATPEPHTPPTPRKKDRRSQTSPVNGAKSQGPTSDSGKARCSQNALRHGITSKRPVLATESHEEYNQLRQAYLDLCLPTNTLESDLVEDIIDARWRLRRIKRHEQKILNLEMARALDDDATEFEQIDPGTLEAFAFQRATCDRSLENIDRYERRYDRLYHRSIEKLLKLRGQRTFHDPIAAAEDAGSPATPAPAPNEPIPDPVAPPAPPRAWRHWLPFLSTLILIGFLLLAPMFAALSQNPQSRPTGTGALSPNPQAATAQITVFPATSRSAPRLHHHRSENGRGTHLGRSGRQHLNGSGWSLPLHLRRQERLFPKHRGSQIPGVLVGSRRAGAVFHGE